MFFSSSSLTQREAARVDVHLGEAQVFEWPGQGKGSLHGDVTEQVRLLTALLQLVGGVVQHLLVPVTHLLHFDAVDLRSQTDELPSQAVVLQLHFPLEGQGRDGECRSVIISERESANIWISHNALNIGIDLSSTGREKNEVSMTSNLTMRS